MEMSDASVEPGLSNRTVSDLLRAAAVPLALALLCATGCYIAAGPTLGLFFGGMLFCAIITPPLLAWEPDRTGRLFVAGAVIDGTAAVWLVAVFTSPTTVVQWLLSYLVLMGWVAALWGLVALLGRLLRSALAAQAVTVLVAMAWLSWPVWLSPWLAGQRGAAVASWLTAAHPLMAINGVLLHLGVWSEQSIAYWLTNLGQDVPYSLPSVWAAVGLHLLLGIALIWFAGLKSEAGAADRPG